MACSCYFCKLRQPIVSLEKESMSNTATMLVPVCASTSTTVNEGQRRSTTSTTSTTSTKSTETTSVCEKDDCLYREFYEFDTPEYIHDLPPDLIIKPVSRKGDLPNTTSNMVSNTDKTSVKHVSNDETVDDDVITSLVLPHTMPLPLIDDSELKSFRPVYILRILSDNILDRNIRSKIHVYSTVPQCLAYVLYAKVKDVVMLDCTIQRVQDTQTLEVSRKIGKDMFKGGETVILFTCILTVGRTYNNSLYTFAFTNETMKPKIIVE
jgi:hypothetical protein